MFATTVNSLYQLPPQAQFEITVPTGYPPGSILHASCNGETYQITVPPGVEAGQTIRVQPAQQQQTTVVGTPVPTPLPPLPRGTFEITVPPGFIPGSILQARGPDGLLYQVTIPAGVAVGQSIRVQTATHASRTYTPPQPPHVQFLPPEKKKGFFDKIADSLNAGFKALDDATDMGDIFGGNNNSSSSSSSILSGLYINGINVPVSSTNIYPFEALVMFRRGHYWHDTVSGAWGELGGPCLGTFPAGYRIAGEGLQPPAGCSGVGSGAYLNGREMHPLDLLQLQLAGVPAVRGGSRWAVDGRGVVTVEGTGTVVCCIALPMLAQNTRPEVIPMAVAVAI